MGKKLYIFSQNYSFQEQPPWRAPPLKELREVKLLHKGHQDDTQGHRE